MIPYVGCEHARELLEGFADGELSVDDQVAVESHLRWCRTCTAHVDDLRLIGVSVRGLPAGVSSDDAQAMASVQAGVLARVRAERDQAFLSRVRVTFSDTRLLFPALGATLALLLCFGLTYSVQVTTSRQLSELLLGKTRPRIVDAAQAPYAVRMLEQSADPGSDLNPLRVDDAFLIPQLLNEEVLAAIPDDEATFTLATVVSRKGRIENYELLRASSERGNPMSDAVRANHVDTVLSAVRQSRFSPAQTHVGGAVAVNMVWLIAKTTAVQPQVKPAVAKTLRPAEPVLAPSPVPSDIVPAEPGRSGSLLESTTIA
jgi:hypothetical protein